MAKGNSEKRQIAQRIEEARDALNEALRLLKGAGLEHPTASRKDLNTARSVAGASLDFTMPIRAFVKKHSQGMNGSEKFTLLIAYLTKGDTSKTVPLSQIQSHWNKMKSKRLLGMKFNRLYTSQARESDWATAEKAGAYHLRPSWKTIFNA